jgi:hypothetical protein
VADKPASSPSPAGFPSPDAAIVEVCRFRRESPRQVYRILVKGIYRGHKNGNSRLIP